jgi:hypothetical protein
MLLKQGLMLFPPSLGQTWQTASIKRELKQEDLMRESVVKTRLYHSNPKIWMTLGVENLGQGRHPPFNLQNQN